MTVVGNKDQSALELLQVLFKNINGHDVQIVRRFVHYQQVRLPHQDGQQVETAFLSSGKFADAVVQHIVRKEELAQQMSVIHCLQNSLVLIELHSALAIVADLQRLSPFDHTCHRAWIGRIYIPDQKIDESGFSDPILSNYSDFLVTLEIVCEMAQVAVSAIVETDILAVDDLCSKP